MTTLINFSFLKERQLIGNGETYDTHSCFFFCRSRRTLDKVSNTSLVQVPTDNYTRLFSYRKIETPGMSNTTFLRIYENQCRQTAPSERRSPHLALCPCVSPYLGERHIPVKDPNSSQTQKENIPVGCVVASSRGEGGRPAGGSRVSGIRVSGCGVLDE